MKKIYKYKEGLMGKNTNNVEEDSLIEVVVRLMQKRKKPQTLEEIASEVFKAKKNPASEQGKLKAQFFSDFMLSGYFVCCGDDKNEKKLWDLKEHLSSDWLDKDGGALDDLYEEDEDVKDNELMDDKIQGIDGALEEEDEDDDEKEEKDDLADEFDDLEAANDREIQEIDSSRLRDDDEDEEEAEEEDDIEQELKGK
jgi:DNA-directed RNA polymerase subunit delta